MPYDLLPADGYETVRRADIHFTICNSGGGVDGFGEFVLGHFGEHVGGFGDAEVSLAADAVDVAIDDDW